MKSPEELMESACKNAETYMREAKSKVQEIFGEESLRLHPQLISAFMQTAALDYLAESLSQTIRGMED